MWLEELVWLWLPVVCGIGGWMSWRLVNLTAEVRELRTRLEQLEQTNTDDEQKWSRVA